MPRAGCQENNMCLVRKTGDTKVNCQMSATAKRAQRQVSSSQVGQQVNSTQVGHQVNSTCAQRQVSSSQVGQQVNSSHVEQQVSSSQAGQQVNCRQVAQQVNVSQVNSSQIEPQVSSSQVEQQVNSSQVEPQVNSTRAKRQTGVTHVEPLGSRTSKPTECQAAGTGAEWQINTASEREPSGMPTSHREDHVLPSHLGGRLGSRPEGAVFLPDFGDATEAVLREGHVRFLKDGTRLDRSLVKLAVLRKLADFMYSNYTAYPRSHEVRRVAEALVRKYPCLREPASPTGCEGWIYSLKNKMANFRVKLRDLGLPEVTCNSLKNKRPHERNCAQNIKKARKGEVVFLPDYLGRDDKEQQKRDRQLLIAKWEEKDVLAVNILMHRTFTHRRHDVVILRKSVKDIKEQWPALFHDKAVSWRTTVCQVIAYLGIIN